METADQYRIKVLETALQSAAVLLRSTADKVDSGQRIDPETLRSAAHEADEIAGR